MMIKFRSMKKIFLFLSSLLLIVGCEKDFTNVVVTSEQSFQVLGVGMINDIIYNSAEPNVNLTIQFSSGSSFKTVHANIIGVEKRNVNSSSINFYDDGSSINGDVTKGDNIYSSLYPLPSNLPNGKYTVDYFVIKTNGEGIKVTSQNFNFDNGASNVAPAISNLSLPDTVRITTDTTYIMVALSVSDSNGYNDIEKVFFNSYIPPNGTLSSSSPISLFDDGSNGDVTARDGVFSRIVILPPVGVNRGVYRWEFQAKDRGKKSSNVIIHYLYVL